MRTDKITRVAQSAEGKARDVRHWMRRGARFRHPRRQRGSATVRAIHYKMDHARGSADDIRAGGPSSFTTIARPAQKGLAFRSASSIVSSSDAARMMRG